MYILEIGLQYNGKLQREFYLFFEVSKNENEERWRRNGNHRYSPNDSLRGRRLKGKGKGVLGARETREAREGGVRRGTLARKPLFLPSRLLIKKITKITQL